jgi:signal transduction histidine kinase
MLFCNLRAENLQLSQTLGLYSSLQFQLGLNQSLRGYVIHRIATSRPTPITLLCCFLGLLLLGSALLARADNTPPEGIPPAVNVALPQVELGPWSQVIKDIDGTMTAEQLLAHPGTTGHRGDIVTSFTFTHAAYWFVIPLHNPQATPLTRLLVFEPTWLDDVRVTLAEPDGTRHRYHGGDGDPFSQRSLPHRKINFELALPPGNSQLLVRVQTQDPFVVGMGLWERSAFFQADSQESGYIGLVYGVLGAMLLYNLVLFISVRETVYAAYVAYVLSFMLMHATYNGHFFPLLWPNSPAWGNWAHSIFIYLFVMAGLYFAINFLELRTRMGPAFLWAQRLLQAIMASGLITAAVGGYGLHVSSSIIWIIIYALFTLILGALSLRAGNRAARYFLPATAAGFIGSGITALAVAGIIPFSLFTYRAADFGMLIDAILLSIALADRLKLARTEAEQARTKLFDSTRLHALQLEEEVALRTLELEEANAAKDKFFSIIAHDLRGPIGSLALFYNHIVVSTQDFNEEILQLTRTTTNNLNNFLEQLLTWARSQRGEIDCTPETIDLQQLLRETEGLFSTQAQAKGIYLNLTLDEPCPVFADVAMVNTILRNLINNALKYTANGGTVSATASTRGEHYLIKITDSGVGMDEETQYALFQLHAKPQSTPGTQLEPGTGFGLLLCHEFVIKNGGTIGVQSEKGKGSTFWFTLPRATRIHGAA